MMLATATIGGVVSPRDFTPRRNFLAGGGSRRLIEIDRHYDDSGVVWQEAVYRFARTVADKTKPSVVVDMGTGTGLKLRTAFANYAAQKVQTDWHDERDPAQDGEARPEFYAVNLEQPDDLEIFESRLAQCEPSLFILSDVIEHLRDPRPLLRTLRRLLRRHGRNRLVISTPDRYRVDGARAEDIPDNHGHVRQWTLNEFGLALYSAGFEVLTVGRVPQNQYDADGRTICCEVSCSLEYYVAWLRKNELPAPTDHVVITTEHAKANRTGGIGTYAQLTEEVGDQRRLILFAGSMGLPEAGWCDVTRAHGWIHVADIRGLGGCPLSEVAKCDPDEILQALLQVLFLYDDVRLVEYQDYVGVGARVAQAKRAGLFPASVVFMAYVHGNHFYLDAAGGEVSGDRPLAVDARERLSIELADVVFFPTRYIRNLCVEEAGFRPRAERYVPLPIAISRYGPDDLAYAPIRNVVFFGKRTPQKGYPDFVDAIHKLLISRTYKEAAARLRSVELVGVSDPGPLLEDLALTVNYGVRSRAESLDMLRRLAADSLVVLPYRGDNYPVSLLEVVDTGCQFVAFDAGGIPEIVPEEVADKLLCAPNPDALAAAMARAITMTHWERCRLIEQTRALVYETCIRNIGAYNAAIAALKCQELSPAQPHALGAVTVVVPNLNGKREWLEDVALGLRNSFHRPAGVVLVDDGSSDDGLRSLQESLGSFGDIPIEVIRNPRNLGLGGARNAGLERVRTPYVCPHDNDNIILNNLLAIGCRILDENTEVAAVTFWNRYFNDGSFWQKEDDGPGYRPLGADLGLALHVNSLGDALGVYRVADLRAIGGWGQTAADGPFEDWELLAKLVAAGKEVWVVPQEQMLYRVRRDSMIRTSRRFPGWLRLSNALPGLPRAHAVALLRSVWTPSVVCGGDLEPVAGRIRHLEYELANSSAWGHDLERVLAEVRSTLRNRTADLHVLRARNEEIFAEVMRLRAIEASTTWRATYRLRRFFSCHPRLRKAFRSPLAAMWRGARAVRNAAWQR